MAAKIRYAAFPDAHVYEKKGSKKTIQHLIWGDWLTVKQEDGEWSEVHARGCDGWMKTSSLQEQRLLEVIFVDIGQGDGALLVTPEDKHYLIDAGEGDNMERFCRWRFGEFRTKWTFEAAVISHPDKDHYGGFAPFFNNPNVSFNAIYHNGIMERNSAEDGDRLGPRVKRDNRTYCTSLVADEAALTAFLRKASNWKDKNGRPNKQYPELLATALNSGRVKAGGIRMLSAVDGHLPGLRDKKMPGGKTLSVEVLGPVTATSPDGSPSLPWFGDVGKTKNGHSVVLRLTYGDVRVMLGGDLNIPSEEYLLEHYTRINPQRVTGSEEVPFLEAARRAFQVDIAKSCHHGSGDVLEVFLRALNPVASVISSGDDEPHAHPRAETLGAIGRHSRGGRPLIFSTELVRSTKETVKRPHELRDELRAAAAAIATAKNDTARERAQLSFEKLLKKIERSVAVYGAVNLRTDGERALMAYRLEQPRNSGGKLTKWDLYPMTPSANGLRFRSKHDANDE